MIFGDVKLRAAEQADVARALGAAGNQPANPPKPAKTTIARLPQPCAAFDGNLCRIYADRPRYCQAFECVLFQAVQSGGVRPEAALTRIRLARRRAALVRRLLKELGDAEEQSGSLAERVSRTVKRLEKEGAGPDDAATFGRLTIAWHKLSLLLAEEFYPG